MITIDDLEEEARRKLSSMAYGYYRSGADEEHTLRRNRDAWARYAIWYRTLVDVSAPQIATTVLGTPVSSPILVAPTAYHALAHRDGELATVRATSEAGVLYVASTLATAKLEDVAAAAPDAPLWFQLYVHKDRAFTSRLIARAKAAGYRAIVLTVDTPVLGRRCADVRNSFALPAGMVMANLVDALPEGMDPSGSELARYVASRHDASLTLRDLESLAREIDPLPLVVKGVVRPDDARAALEHGAKAIWISNHGGRQLDLAPATADALPEVVAAVGARAEVYVDGGIRSGTHALVALGLGARAVFVGRPILWGLACDGQRGVSRSLTILREELVRAMQLAGCPDLETARHDLVQRAR